MREGYKIIMIESFVFSPCQRACLIKVAIEAFVSTNDFRLVLTKYRY